MTTNIKACVLAGASALALVCAAPSASAFTIVDTGTPTETGGLLMDADQWLAGRFLVTAPVRITDVSGFIGDLSALDSGFDQGGTFHIAILKDGPNATLYSAQVSVPTTGSTDPVWRGLSGLSWDLTTPDYYAVAFEVLPGDTFAGYMPRTPPNPLGIEYFTSNGAWTRYDAVDAGWQILGTDIPAPPPVGGAVPEPASWALMLGGFGLAGATLRRRRAFA